MWVRILAVIAAVAVAASAYVLALPSTQPSEVAQAPQTMVPAGPTARPPVATATDVPQPGATTSTPLAPPPPSAVALSGAEQRAVARLSSIVGRSRVGGTLSVTVVDAQGRTVFGHASSRPVLPASTQKLAVAGAALAQFGPEYRYTTTVTAARRPNPQGVVQGDLFLVGGGDPALAQPVFAAIEPDRPRTPLESLVTQLKRAGVRAVTGRVVGDPSFLANEPVAAGWPPRYFDELDTTNISGLTIDAGRRIVNERGVLQATVAPDPARQAAAAFRQLLTKRGIKVRGGVATATRPTPDAGALASVSSPPMGTLLRYMVQRSDNHLADTIFRTVGAARGDSTWIGAAGATAEVLGPLRLDWTGVVLADGSGLSRSNRVSSDFLAQLEARMWQSNLRDQWIELLALSGSRGTLRSRFLGTPAEQRVYGKTGSLRDVSALVGTVAGTKGRQLHFAIIGNRLESTDRMREATDRVVIAMAEEIQDCRRIPRPPRKNGKPRLPRLVCG